MGEREIVNNLCGLRRRVIRTKSRDHRLPLPCAARIPMSTVNDPPSLERSGKVLPDKRDFCCSFQRISRDCMN